MGTVFLIITEIDQSKTTKTDTFNTSLQMTVNYIPSTNAVDGKMAITYMYLKHQHFLKYVVMIRLFNNKITIYLPADIFV